MGFGFRLRIDVELRFDLDGIRFVDADGTEISFPAYTSTSRRIARHGYVLESLDSQTARVKTLDGFRYDFQIRAGATRLRPMAIVHENGARANITYDAHERPTSIVHDANTWIAIEYEDSRVRRVKLIEAGTGKQHRLVDYEYDSKGFLLSATDPYGHALKYQYDASGNLVRKTDRRGYSFLFTYDADGRCLRTYGEDGQIPRRIRSRTSFHARRWNGRPARTWSSQRATPVGAWILRLRSTQRSWSPTMAPHRL